VLVSKKPILSPGDTKGLRVRIFDSETLKQFWRDLGAIPVFVPWADVNVALDGGPVDVLPTHHALVYSLGFCKKAKYVTHIGEMPSILVVAMNESKYQMLSPAHQEAIQKACHKAGQKFSGFVKDTEEKNEQLTMDKFNAIHINTGNEPWKEKLNHTTDQLIKKGILSRDVWQEVEKTRPR
jgi:TRAP-type C4-dicarboxylate transport system substrate-binding protein